MSYGIPGNCSFHICSPGFPRPCLSSGVGANAGQGWPQLKPPPLLCASAPHRGCPGSLQKFPAYRTCTPASGHPGCLWALGRSLPQVRCSVEAPSPEPWRWRLGVGGTGGMERSGSDVDTDEVRNQRAHHMAFASLFFLDSRGQWWTPQEQPSARGNPRGDQGPHLLAPGPASSLQQSRNQQPLWSGSGRPDCRHSPHGCCPDGLTASLGPQWQGCPGASCQQSR